MNGRYMSGMSKFDAEEKDSRKPNERLHAVVWRRGEGRGEGGERIDEGKLNQPQCRFLS